MKQRIVSLLMVCILALTMPAQAFASETTITALYQEPEIKVKVNASNAAGELIINPYSLPMTVEGKVQFAQIVNMPWSIENQSEVAINVDAQVSAEVAEGSTMQLSKKSVKTNESEEKLAFMYLDMKVTDPDVVLTDLNWFETVYSKSRQLLITESINERKKVMTLAAANEDGTTANGGVGAFHIYGNANPDPVDDWDPSTDKVTIEVVLTFRPTTIK